MSEHRRRVDPVLDPSHLADLSERPSSAAQGGPGASARPE